MTEQNFNCYSSTSNPTGDVAPVHYKVFMCDWKGKIPKAFYGTWNLVSAPDGMCEGYPLTPTAVTFSKVTPDCEDSNFYTAPSRAPLPDVPFAVAIIDPLVYEYKSLSEQAREAFFIAGDPYAGTSYNVSSASCSATTFSTSADFESMPCKFHIEITGFSF
ncbi:hypothetical protein UFOVP822_42 [uncultured Caudovirales phage]|uniref:Uncharacterized protein n=1 Tax=uncultured Caudovirales phage TaxID=2100421 RepID=A0A6J5P7H0_9CAUD|nr:hypothetical protein UFOVP822_42 [uncultured Caudovirales phage]